MAVQNLQKPLNKAELEEMAKKWLYIDYEARRLTNTELMGFVEILAALETEDELNLIMGLLAEDHPTLMDQFAKKAFVAKSGFEDEMKELVKTVIKQDPLLAAKVAKAATESDMTLEKLVAQFPELANYLNQA